MLVDIEKIIDQLDKYPKSHILTIGDLKVLLINALDNQVDEENKHEQDLDDAYNSLDHY